MPGYELEFKDMIISARMYLNDEMEFIEFYYKILEAFHFAQKFAPQTKIIDIIREWMEVSDRCRNEWGICKDPLTETEFKQWLTTQL